MDGLSQKRRSRQKVNVREGNHLHWLVYIGGENKEQKNVMKIGKEMRTRNTGILSLGHAFSKLSFGDWTTSGTFFVVTVSDKDSRCDVSFCILLQLRFALFLNIASGLRLKFGGVTISTVYRWSIFQVEWLITTLIPFYTELPAGKHMWREKKLRDCRNSKKENLKPCGTFHVVLERMLACVMSCFVTNELINMFQFCLAMALFVSFLFCPI